MKMFNQLRTDIENRKSHISELKEKLNAYEYNKAHRWDDIDSLAKANKCLKYKIYDMSTILRFPNKRHCLKWATSSGYRDYVFVYRTLHVLFLLLKLLTDFVRN